MRLTIMAIVGAVVLSGCQPEGEKAPADVTAADAQAVIEQKEQNILPAAPRQPEVPEGAIAIAGVVVTPDFEFTRRYDRVRKTTKTKQDQRQILLEAEVASVEEALARITSTLERAGFSADEPRQQYSGLRTKFTLEGQRDVFVLVRDSSNGPTIQNENSAASVYLTQLK